MKRSGTRIRAIVVYKQNGIWAFDDASVGLLQEPFVVGIPEMIELLVKDIPGAEAGFTLWFSASPFPGQQARLRWVREEAQGHWYRESETRREGWLCPALLRYFPVAPKQLYCAASPTGSKP